MPPKKPTKRKRSISKKSPNSSNKKVKGSLPSESISKKEQKFETKFKSSQKYLEESVGQGNKHGEIRSDSLTINPIEKTNTEYIGQNYNENIEKNKSDSIPSFLNITREPESNGIYVDKTNIIYELIKKPAAMLIIGPRRCGKTLLLSTIETVFTENPNWWNTHGKNLKIVEDHPEFLSEMPFPILNFNFHQCLNNEQFQRKVKRYIKSALKNNKVHCNYDIETIDWEKLIDTVIPEVVDLLREKFNQLPVVLIDEYDQPIINQLFANDEIPREQKIKNIEFTLNSFKFFYGLLKELLVKEIRSVVICGHSMIAQTSIFSGFNNVVVLRKQNKEQFHQLLGFTENEIKKNFSRCIKEITEMYNLTSENSVLDILRKHYNGFLQSPYAKESLYNPYGIQNYFNSNGKLNDYFAESGGTEIIFKVLKNTSILQVSNFLKSILNDDYKIPIEETEMITAKSWDEFETDFNQIAFDAGHLTMAIENGKYFLKISNQEMRNNFIKMINRCIFQNVYFGYLNECLIGGDFKTFFSSLEEIAFKNRSILNLKDIPNDCMDQANYEVFLHQACSLVIKQMLIESKEKNKIKDFNFQNEATPNEKNKSRMDLYLMIEDNFLVTNEYIFEYKIMFNKNKNLISNASKAIQQIFNQNYYEIFKKENCFIIGIGFNIYQENIISDILVKKFKGLDLAEEKNWETVFRSENKN